MDKTLTTNKGGLPFTWDTMRQFLGQNGAANHGIYQAFNNMLADYGTNLIIQGCVVTGTNPNKSLSEGWIYLGGELLKVEAIAGTLDTSTDSTYTLSTTTPFAGQRLAQNGKNVFMYENRRGVLNGSGGTLAFDATPFSTLQSLINRTSAGVETRLIHGYKRLQFPVWDMNANQGENVSHGLTTAQAATIVIVGTVVFPDTGTNNRPLNYWDDGTELVNGGIGTIGATAIELWRLTGGTFDSVNFDSTASSRGHVTIMYEV